MRRSTTDAVALFAVAVASLPPVLSALSLDYSPVRADELSFAWSGARVAGGELAYRNFFTHTPPVAVYGLGATMALFGQTLATLRVVQITLLATTTMTLLALARRTGGGLVSSAVLALLPSWALFWCWPVPGAQWCCLQLAALALLLVHRPTAPPRAWFVAGFCAGCAGLTYQPLGAIACGWLLLLATASPPRPRRLRLALFGIGLPLAATAIALAACGTLGATIDAVVVFPAKFYGRAGGFNDVAAAAGFAEGLAAARARGPLALTVHVGVLALAAGTALLTVARLARRRDLAASGDAVALAILIVVFLRGRSDWPHAVFLLPFVLLLGWRQLYHPTTSPALRRAGTVVAGLILAASVLMWTAQWFERPLHQPSVAVDAAMRAQVHAALAELPAEVRAAPLLALPYGSSFYLFRSAPAPRVDWVLPPSQRYNPDSDYQHLADWLTRLRVPVVALVGPFGLALAQEPSPLATVLQRDYRQHRQLGALLLLLRRP